MPKAKPYSGPVETNLASQVLNSTGVKVGEDLLGDALRHAATRLESLVKQANAEMEGNDFAGIVAEHLAVKMNRRGSAHLTVSDTGKMLLHISYEDARPVPKVTRQRTAPLMKELKARAEELGVDISPFGIKRTKIHEFLEKVAAGAVVPQGESGPKALPSAPRAKAPRAVERVPTPDVANEEPPAAPVDPGPMSAGPDETVVSEMPETPPPRRSIVKTAEVREGPVVVDASEQRARNGSNPAKTQGEAAPPKSMRQLVQESKEVDIADLLASDPPE